MTRTHPQNLLFPSLFIILLFTQLFLTSNGDVGTAAQYSPPYLPTDCYGSDSSQFPSSNLFAAAGDGIWDNGASCGRQYLVRCISAAVTGTCIPDTTIQIRIVDYAAGVASKPSADGTTMVLSQTAFAAIANSTATSINIEFQQV
ncbi:EG45-like domain containing protein isoform X2 [Rosa chinensis]|uniref:EG45-like domain containing protein isoform X2 n=1 Tax=Rosa chinensis TaxID=74649 RepID=UPI000D091AC0|nr:EG45-like domain containing protein isoform X2 [Rosa chinensis]